MINFFQSLRKGEGDDMVEHYLLTPSEAAEFLRVSESTVYRLLTKGVLPGVKVGRSWRLNRKDLEFYLKSPNKFLEGDGA